MAAAGSQAPYTYYHLDARWTAVKVVAPTLLLKYLDLVAVRLLSFSFPSTTTRQSHYRFLTTILASL